MSQTCDHCDVAILTGVEPIEGEDGKYCSQICRYDEEILGVSAAELPPR